MKTKINKLFLLAIVLLTPNLVNAASLCTYEQQVELNNIVANVNATYEVVDVRTGTTLDFENGTGIAKEVDSYTKGFNINILNITDDIYVEVRNNYDNSVKTFKSNNINDGIATFQTTNISSLITYTINIYSNKYSCIGEQFRTFTITTPKYNYYSRLEVCEENPGFYYCQEFVSTDNVGDYFYENLEKYKKEQEQQKLEEEKTKNFIEKLKEFYQNNNIIINSVMIVIFVVGVATTVILIKKKRSRVL